MSAKFIQVAEAIKQRIRTGDFLLEQVLSERRLAENSGVSYMTARRAVKHLIAENVLCRSETGRLQVAAGEPDTRRQFKVAYICHYMGATSLWMHAARQAAKRQGVLFREVLFAQADDSIVFHALDGDFDLVFISHPLDTPALLQKVQRLNDRVVVMFRDHAALGLRSLLALPGDAIRPLIDHLHALGHRRIGCFSLASHSDSPAAMSAWRKAVDELGCEGTLHRPEHPLEEGLNFVRAKRFADDLLDAGTLRDTAMFCTGTEEAIGFIRSLHEHGLEVPRDLSVVSFGNQQLAQTFIPAITVMHAEDPVSTFEEAIRHQVRRQSEPYLGFEKMHYRVPVINPLFMGESTAPPARASAAALSPEVRR